MPNEINPTRQRIQEITLRIAEVRATVKNGTRHDPALTRQLVAQLDILLKELVGPPRIPPPPSVSLRDKS